MAPLYPKVRDRLGRESREKTRRRAEIPVGVEILCLCISRLYLSSVFQAGLLGLRRTRPRFGVPVPGQLLVFLSHGGEICGKLTAYGFLIVETARKRDR